MINKKIEQELNNQINAEIYSSYLYLSMSAYAETQNLSGFASWLKAQAQEEVTHAMKIFDHVVERGGRVVLGKIDGPKTDWEDMVEVFEDVYEHEQKVTAMIHRLVDMAIEQKDHATFNFLQWFVEEQVEEEDSSSKVLEKLKMVQGKGAGIFMLDRELSKR